MSSTTTQDEAAREPVAVECRLEPWGKPGEDSHQLHRYKLFFDDSSSQWLSRTTTILKALREDGQRREVAELPKVEHFLRSGEWPEEDWEKLPEPERAALAAFMGWWNENMLIAGAMTDLHAAHLDYKYGATVDFLLVDRAGDLHAIFRDTGMDIEKELLRMGAAVGALVSIRGLRVKAASLLRPGRPLRDGWPRAPRAH